MLTNITPRERVTDESYEILFYVDENGGLGFPCDKDGNLFELMDAARANYEYAMAHPEKYPYYWNHKKRYQHTYFKNASGDCICGNRVELWDQYQGACKCDKCGRWYNLFGQELLPPEYWEPDYEY